MTADEWGEVRSRWESDPREGYTWIVSEMNLGVSDVAVLKRARKEGWAKKASLKTIVERAQAKADEKVSRKVSRKVSGEVSQKVSPLTDSEVVDLRASVVENNQDVGGGPVEPAAKIGRPTDYKPDYAERGYKLTLLGLTDEEIADVFEVARSTLSLWKHKYPEFSDALRRGKEEADAEVAASLYHRARGYSHPETHVAVFQGQVIQTELVKHYPPDTGAALLWLKNRQSKNWKDKVEVKQDVNLNVFPSKEALDSIYNRVLAEAAKRDAILVGRRERLGIVVDVEARDVD